MIERVLDQAQHNPAPSGRFLDDEVRWDVGALDIPDTGATWRGPEGVREFFTPLGRPIRRMGL